MKIIVDENCLPIYNKYSKYNFKKNCEMIKSHQLNYKMFKDGEKIFPYGSWYFINECKKYLSNTNLIILPDEEWKFEYNFYMKLFKQEKLDNYFLNNNFKFTTIGLMRSKKEMFIRPNSTKKIFTGDLYTKENLLYLHDHLKNNTEIIISEPKEISEEWRLTIIDRKIISWSEYTWENRTLKPRNEIPHAILELASEIAKCVYQPSNAYILDTCISEGKAKIIEINSINTSCFYNSNIELIFKTLERHYGI